MKTIQAIVGHSDAQTTINRYIHSRDEKKQEAVRSVNEILAIQGKSMLNLRFIMVKIFAVLCHF